MKQFEIVQYAASERETILFRLTGSDLNQLRLDAQKAEIDLAQRGVTALRSLRAERELIPNTLSNRAKEQGKAGRNARRLLASGKYTGNEMLNAETGRWELPS